MFFRLPSYAIYWHWFNHKEGIMEKLIDQMKKDMTLQTHDVGGVWIYKAFSFAYFTWRLHENQVLWYPCQPESKKQVETVQGDFGCFGTRSDNRYFINELAGIVVGCDRNRSLYLSCVQERTDENEYDDTQIKLCTNINRHGWQDKKEYFEILWWRGTGQVRLVFWEQSISRQNFVGQWENHMALQIKTAPNMRKPDHSLNISKRLITHGIVIDERRLRPT